MKKIIIGLIILSFASACFGYSYWEKPKRKRRPSQLRVYIPSDSGPSSGSGILLETGDYLLLETGDYLLLES